MSIEACFLCSTPLQLAFANQIISLKYRAQPVTIFYDGIECDYNSQPLTQLIRLARSRGSAFDRNDQDNCKKIKNALFDRRGQIKKSFESCDFFFANICWPTANHLYFIVTRHARSVCFYYEGLGSYLRHGQSTTYKMRNFAKFLITKIFKNSSYRPYPGTFMFGLEYKTRRFYGPSIGSSVSIFKDYQPIELPADLFIESTSSASEPITQVRPQAIFLGWPTKRDEDQIALLRQAQQLAGHQTKILYKTHPLQRTSPTFEKTLTLELNVEVLDTNAIIEKLFDPNIHCALFSPFSSALIHIKSRHPSVRCVALLDHEFFSRPAKYGVIPIESVTKIFKRFDIETVCFNEKSSKE